MCIWMIKCTLRNEAKLHKLYYKVCMKKQSCQSKVVSPGILYLKNPFIKKCEAE